MGLFKPGQKSLDVCRQIVWNHPEIVSVTLVSHEVGINWRQAYDDNRKKISNLETAFAHGAALEERICTRAEFLKLTSAELKVPGKHQVWSLKSKVRCADGTNKHLPMMNFHPLDDVTLDAIEATIKGVSGGAVGAILESGRYYHYYGDYLLGEKDWHKFLADFLMPCVVVSPRYVGHSLHEGFCSLRLTADDKYKPKIPEVVRVLNKG